MVQYIPILSMPDKSDRYFIAKTEGGLNPGVPRKTGSKLHFANCVFFAIGAYAKHWGTWLPSVNAENLYAAAEEMGLSVSQTPQLGALIVWAAGKVGNGTDGAGHVASVEKINADGSIVTAESGWGASKAFWATTRKRCSDGNWGQKSTYRFLGFILPPVQLVHALREGDRGAEVELMQARLAAKGFLRRSEVDGDFGLITLGALLAFQFKSGLEVDGVCGPKTRAKLTE